MATYEGAYKNILQSTINGIASIYEDFIYEGYITNKYKQRLNNIRLITIYNLKEIPDSKKKEDILYHIEILRNAQTKLNDGIEEEGAVLVYLLSKFYYLNKKYDLSFSYKGLHTTLNPKILEELMVEYNEDIYRLFDEYLIVREEDDNTDGALSLDDI